MLSWQDGCREWWRKWPTKSRIQRFPGFFIKRLSVCTRVPHKGNSSEGPPFFIMPGSETNDGVVNAQTAWGSSQGPLVQGLVRHPLRCWLRFNKTTAKQWTTYRTIVVLLANFGLERFHWILVILHGVSLVEGGPRRRVSFELLSPVVAHIAACLIL